MRSEDDYVDKNNILTFAIMSSLTYHGHDEDKINYELEQHKITGIRFNQIESNKLKENDGTTKCSVFTADECIIISFMGTHPRVLGMNTEINLLPAGQESETLRDDRTVLIEENSHVGNRPN